MLIELLAVIRAHPSFPDLLKQIPAPQWPRYRTSEQPADKFAANAIYFSGRRDQHEAWLTLLAGKPTAQEETHERE